jgi:DNA invertase Pin-like site-specific DNA recombinase
MNIPSHQKVTAHHLARKAFVYVRQSTVRQVFENSESTKRQYDLQQTAVALGWTLEQVVVIDSDLGKSGASKDRDGFRRLVAEVGLNNVGVVLSLEVSRFARNSGDWHQLLEICALTDTLIVDEAGIYDPSQFNDRLLLGLKGTMSEAELHVMRARLRGGLLNKARRGELECQIPAGFVYDHQGRVVLDPDKQVQNSVRLLFETFSRTGTAYATAMHFRKQSLRFPTRVHGGARHGELHWRLLTHQRVVDALHNPCYAGAFAYGRKQSRKRANGPNSTHRRPREQWLALVLDAHPAYITWSEHEANVALLRETARAFGSERYHGPAREGPALLQGVLLCGVCGARMNVRYRRRRDGLVPYYYCRVSDEQQVVRLCSAICGASLDAAVSELLVASLTPEAVEVALEVEQEMRARVEQTDRLRMQQVERARYEADVARRRFMQVDPDNRLVASSLEEEWNSALHSLHEAQDTLERQRHEDNVLRNRTDHDALLALSQRFAEIWHAPTTPHRERKRMLRLMIEDVTLVKSQQLSLHVRFRGGATTTLCIPYPLPNWRLIKTDDTVVAEIDSLLASHTYSEIAHVLNTRGSSTGFGARFSRSSVGTVVVQYQLGNLKKRMRSAGMISARELAKKLGVVVETIYSWQQRGLIDGKVCNAKRERMYDPCTHPVAPACSRKTSSSRTSPQTHLGDPNQGVQYD